MRMKFHVLFSELANLSTICTFWGKFGRNVETWFVVENEISSVRIAIFIAKMDSAPFITLGALGLCISNHQKLTFEQFLPDFVQKTQQI